MIKIANSRRIQNSCNLLLSWSGRHISEQIQTKIYDYADQRPLHQIVLDKEDGKLPGSHKSSNLSGLCARSDQARPISGELNKSIDSGASNMNHMAKIAKFRLNKALQMER